MYAYMYVSKFCFHIALSNCWFFYKLFICTYIFMYILYTLYTKYPLLVALFQYIHMRVVREEQVRSKLCRITEIDIKWSRSYLKLWRIIKIFYLPCRCGGISGNFHIHINNYKFFTDIFWIQRLSAVQIFYEQVQRYECSEQNWWWTQCINEKNSPALFYFLCFLLKFEKVALKAVEILNFKDVLMNYKLNVTSAQSALKYYYFILIF